MQHMSAVFGDMCCKYCRWPPIVVFTSNNTLQNVVRVYLVHFVDNCNISYLYSTLFVTSNEYSLYNGEHNVSNLDVI